MIRGTQKRSSSTAGAWASTSSRSRQATSDVLAHDGVLGEGVRRRRHVREVERGDVLGVVEHRGQLHRVAVELLVAQREAREGRDVGDVGAGERAQRPSKAASRNRPVSASMSAAS